MLAVRRRSCSPIRCGASNARMILSAQTAASCACTTSASRIKNSSPPCRLTVSELRTQERSLRATERSNSSPIAWPRESLMCLKRSKSMNSSATELPLRCARMMACSSRSLNKVRFGTSVRLSCNASRASFCDSSRAAVTSCATITAPTTPPWRSWIGAAEASTASSTPSRRISTQSVSRPRVLSSMMARVDGLWIFSRGRHLDELKHIVERAPRGLRLGPSGHLFGDHVQIRDVAAKVAADDGIADRVERDLSALLFLEQRLGVLRPRLFAGLQRAFHGAPAADVSEHDDRAGEALAPVAQRHGTVLDGHPAGSRVQYGRMIGRMRLLGEAAQRFEGVFDRRPGIVVANDRKDAFQRAAGRIAHRPSRQRFGDAVQIGNAAARIGGDDGVDDVRECHLEVGSLSLDIVPSGSGTHRRSADSLLRCCVHARNPCRYHTFQPTQKSPRY